VAVVGPIGEGMHTDHVVGMQNEELFIAVRLPLKHLLPIHPDLPEMLYAYK
jgi:hypothetical protein